MQGTGQVNYKKQAHSRANYLNECLTAACVLDFKSMLVTKDGLPESGFLISILYFPGASFVCLNGGDAP